MRTTMVILIVLASLSALAPTAPAETAPAQPGVSSLQQSFDCVVVDADRTPPVAVEPC